MKIIKRIALSLLIIIGLYKLLTLIVPSIVDRSKNGVTLSAPYQVPAEVQAVHNQLSFITDLHCDVLLWERDINEESDYGHVDIPRMQQANMALQAFTIVSKSPKNLNYESNDSDSDDITLLNIAQGRPISNWFSLKERALYQANKLQEAALASKGKFTVIQSRNDLQHYIEDRKTDSGLTAGYLGVEGSHVLEGNIDNVQVMYDAGIRMMAPVHFFDNELGGSAHGVTKGGLTEFGTEVIQKMEDLGMIVDISHSAPKLIDDILSIATKPIIVSHTGIKGTCDNNRNLSDAHLIEIAKRGGLIGIAVFDQAVCGTDAQSTAKAIDYTAKLVGVEHVALGSDFDGSIVAHFDVTGLSLITQELMKMGYSIAEIDQIMGGNARDFLLQWLPTE